MSRRPAIRRRDRAKAADHTDFWRSTWMLSSALVGLVIVVYLPTLRAGFIWDDDMHVLQHAPQQSLSGLMRIWLDPTTTPQYYPLTHTTFWMESQIWDLRAAGYHLVNILLHATNSVLVWLLLRRLSVPGAWLAAAIFAVHPVHVESVAWITERKNLLSLLFYLGAALAWIRLLPPEAHDESPPWSWRWYSLVVVLFLAALLSKTVACSLPAAMLIVAWWKRGAILRREFLATLPLFALGLAFGLTTAYLERSQVKAEGAEWDFTLTDRLLIAGRALWFYAGKLVWPTRLTFIYPRWEINHLQAWQYAFPVAAFGLTLTLCALHRKLGRGLLAAVLFFGGTLLPALGFFNIYPMRYSFVADHFQYAASLGLIALLASSAIWAIARLPEGNRWLGVTACVMLVTVLAVLARRQTAIYSNELSLWSDTVEKNPAWMPLFRLGNALAVEKNFSAAIVAHKKSLDLRPDNDQTHANLGMVYEAQGAFELASEEFTRALRLNPQFVDARNHLGLTLLKQRKHDEATAQFETILASDPKNAEAHNNLGMTFETLGQRDRAKQYYLAAIELDPKLVGAHYNLGNCYFAERRFGDAQEQYRGAIALNPAFGEAHNNLAALLLAEAETHHSRGDKSAASRNIQDAMREYLTWIEIEPSSTIARQNLAGVYERLGRFRDALATLQEAAALQPQDVQIRDRLRSLRSRLGVAEQQP